MFLGENPFPPNGGRLPPESGSLLSSLPKKFGRYEVVRELGKGAMGIVYLGKDPVIGRMVALKTIRVAGEDDSEIREFGERFLREAQAAGILSHPNIVTVHDVGEDPDTHISFIAMEYVEGKNLKQLVAEKTVFAYERVAEIIGQVAEALDYAHRKGIVHRDVKPANVIITSEGAVKITDFGIAKIEKSNLTTEGQFLGTPNYMSPEQVTGDTVDGRSDLFSLGVVLYELLTKKKPFAGENLTSISYKIVHEPFAAPETFDADIPPEFGPILRTALAKNPADRYQRGREFALALYEFKARQEEREMLRDLGQMVAAAENLGGVAAVALPPPTRVTPPAGGTERRDGASALTMAIPEVPAPTGEGPSFEIGGVRSEPVVVAPPPPIVDYSAPDWTLESGVRNGAASGPVPPPIAPPDHGDTGSTRAVPAQMQPVTPPPPDPLDGVTERLDLGKHAAFLASPVPPAVPPPAPVSAPPLPSAVPPPVAAAPKSAPPAPPAAPKAVPPAVAPVGALDMVPSELTERIPTGTPLPPPVRAVPAPSQPVPAPPVPAPAVKAAPTPARSLPPPAVVPPAPRSSGPMAVPPPPDPARVAVPPAPAGVTAPTVIAAIPAGGASAMPGSPAAAAAAAVPAAPADKAAKPATGRTALRRDVNPRFVVMILGAVVLVGLVVVGVLVGRQRSIQPVAPVEDAVVKETEDRRRLMNEGTKLVAEGKYEEALARFRELTRRSPESGAARSAVAKTEALLAEQQAGQKKTQEVEAHVAAARDAETVPDDSRVVSEADAALALDPENAAAKELRSAALARQASKSAAERAKEAAAAKRKAKPTPTPRIVAAVPAPAPRSEPAAPVATPGTMNLRITFQSPVPRGLLMVGVGNSIVFRKDFDFGKSASGGLVDGVVSVPSGPRTVKVWLIATDRSLKPYKTSDLVLPGGESKTLSISLDGSQNLSFGLR